MTILTAKQATDAFKLKTGSSLPPTNSTDYFNKSAGQYATMDRFAFTKKLFGEDYRFQLYTEMNGDSIFNYSEFTSEMTNIISSQGGSVTLLDVLTSTDQDLVNFRYKYKIDVNDFRYGLSQRRELIDDFVNNDLSQSDYVDLLYVYGTSPFALSMNATITILNDEFALNDVVIDPDSIFPAGTVKRGNFDFSSDNAGAQVFNDAWAKTIAPDGGKLFELTFTPEYQTNNTITQYTKTDFLNDQKNTIQHKSENKEAIKKYWNDNFEAIRNKINEEGTEEFDNYEFYSAGGASLALKSLPYIIPSLANDIIAAYVAEEELEKDLMLELDFGNVIGAFSLKDAFHCFPAGTMITLHDGSQKAIENISINDAVLSFDAEGNKVAGRVTQLLENVTDTWLKLSVSAHGSSSAGADSHLRGREQSSVALRSSSPSAQKIDENFQLIVTPGHRFLTPEGSYKEIKDIIATHSRIVDVDGHVVEVTAEAINYSAANAHLFEQHAMMKTWSSGGLAMEPQYVEGWRTYNFTVETHHNYVAENIRVHNDSILSTLQEGDTVVSLSDDFDDMAVLRDVDGDGTDELVFHDGNHIFNGSFLVGYKETITKAPSGVTDVAGYLPEADPNKSYDGIEDVQGDSVTVNGNSYEIDIYSNPLDPDLGNISGDGIKSDDLFELAVDDMGFTVDGDSTYHLVLNGAVNIESLWVETDIFTGLQTFHFLTSDSEGQELSETVSSPDGGSYTTVATAAGTLLKIFELPTEKPDINTPPVAVDDIDFTTSVDTALDIPPGNLTSNDTDADNNILIITSVQDGVNGTPTLNADDSISFVPDSGFSGDASFTYTISDERGGEDTATVSLVVNPSTQTVINGTDGDDYISTNYTDADGQSSSNEGETLEGLEGNDRLYAFAGDDTLLGGAGDDYLRGYAGTDVNDGGAGTDIASYYGSKAGVIVNLETGAASGGNAAGDTFINIEGLMGSQNHGDELTGDAGDNRFYGMGGDDKLIGGGGDDYLRGYDGNDIIDGGAGTDMASYLGSTSGITINLTTDAASGGYAQGDTLISIENILGSKHKDVLTGDAGDNRLSSSDEDDELYGLDGDDHLLGGSGSDILEGGAGNDLLDGGGGTGIDLLTGGADADTFHFDRGEGEDHILDFQDDIDTIEFDDFTGTTTAADFISNYATQTGENVTFDLGDDGKLIVENTTIVQIQNDVELL